MSDTYRRRPGGGFVLVAACLVLVTAFFAWGAHRPRLEQIWRIQIDLDIGERKRLSEDERRLLAQAMWDYPGLAATLLDQADAGLISAHTGDLVDLEYAYIVRQTPEAPGRIQVVAGGAALDAAIPIRVLAGEEALAEGSVSAQEPFESVLPNTGRFPQLVELRFNRPGKGKRGRAALAVRVIR